MKRSLPYSLASLLLAVSLLLSLFGCSTEQAETSSAVPSETENLSDTSSEISETTSQEEEPPMLIISDDPNYTNVTLGKSYTHSPLYPNDSEPSYPDENGKTMTDGEITPEGESFSHASFMGFNKNHSDFTAHGYSAITVDLGGLHYVDKFTAHVGSAYYLSAGIDAPEMIEICLSHDGKTWYKAGRTAHTDTEESNTVAATLTLESALSARYVQYRFIGNGNWMFVCEVEAYGIEADEELPYPENEDEISFLFVGNSSTYFYNVPIKFLQIAKSAGLDVDVSFCCVGSAYLHQFADENDTKHGIPLREHLAAKQYDYVVLQDNSGADYDTSKPAIDILKPLIESNGAKMVLYKRYSSNDDPAQRLDSAYRHEVNYTRLAETFGVDMVAPGADAFLICTEKYPDINLYHTDNSHHGLTGSYLLACTMAIEFLDIDLDAVTYTAGLDDATVKALKECAKIACETGYDFPQDN